MLNSGAFARLSHMYASTVESMLKTCVGLLFTTQKDDH